MSHFEVEITRLVIVQGRKAVVVPWALIWMAVGATKDGPGQDFPPPCAKRTLRSALKFVRHFCSISSFSLAKE
jgi:hypothetical protein